jgi:hypothetical protein
MQFQEASIPDGFTFLLLLNACKVVLGFERLKMASKNACVWWAMYILEKPMSTSFSYMGAECL